jgi:hypothetical protein
MARVDKIFGGAKAVPEEIWREQMVAGGATTLADKLTSDGNWDATSLVVAPIITIEEGSIKGTRMILLGALEDIAVSANAVWAGANKQVKITIEMPDLTVCSFEEEQNNLSSWLERTDMEVKYTLHVPAKGEDEATEKIITYEQACGHGVKDFCLRAAITPTSHIGAKITLAVSPYSKVQLKEKLGDSFNAHEVPHIAVQIKEKSPHSSAKRGKAGYAVFSRREKAKEGYGFGIVPYLDVTTEGEEAATCPSSEALKEELLRFMRSVMREAVTVPAAKVETKMNELIAGTAKSPRTPPHVFPKFNPTTETEELPGKQSSKHN